MRMLNKEEMSIILQRPDCLTCLPMIATLPNGRSVIIDRMTDLQLTETYCMIQEAAQHNDGYGIDEFLTEADFRNEIVGSDCFAITCKSSGEMLAGFILAISKFYRGAAGVVDPFIIVKRSERNQKLGQFAFQKAVDFSKKLGYMGMYVDTFSNNVAIQRILEKLGGFTKVGMLPLGGRLNNGRLIGSVIYYKDLTDDGLNVT
ncbi:hypothetical protein KUTeg_000273 [Tegillarca granosa]|uniref:N-acetyltransferase domain-containing protein n=1 Tax=Tegillarca granosa TaxID=220873 RepID=A0ABQ9FX23_TEGGR|nr:hypothetical protein KUTeg_000273 [Tegillarca granosa]